MIFTCERDDLLSACTTAARASSLKSNIQTLECLMLTAEEKLKVTGYDMKKGIYTYADAEIEETGAVLVNARLFVEMLKKLPSGIVSVKVDEKLNMSIKCGKSKFNIVGMDADKFPELPQFDTVNTIAIPEATLKSMISQTIFAVSADEARPIYTGALFKVTSDTLRIVAIDGYRLAMRVEPITGTHDECTFVVPGTTLSEAEKICNDGVAKLSLGEKHISIAIGNTVIVSRKLEGDFMDYNKAVPTDFAYKVKFNRAEFSASIDRVSLIANEKNTSPVRMTFANASIDMNCRTPIGEAQDVCICEGEADGLVIGFNDRYLRDVMKASASDELVICMNKANTPCVIKSADGAENATFMVLPVRLQK